MGLTVTTDYSVLKLSIIEGLLKVNKTSHFRNIEEGEKELPLLKIQKNAMNQKLHPYDLLKKKGFIKNYI